MVEKSKENDLNSIIDIWLRANIQAHNFIPETYWRENLEIVKKEYIPKSDTYVYKQREKIKGFISIVNKNFIGALFVDTAFQGQSIGTQLIEFCKKNYPSLLLHVYCENKKSIAFYKKCGFKIIKQQETQLKGHLEYVMQWIDIKILDTREGRIDMLNKKTVEDLQVKGKKVLVRCDFNVPIIDGKITDENRIVAALPTINKLLKEGAKVILCSHMGKPKGEPKPELSLAPVAERLSEKLGVKVVFAKDDTVVGENAKKAVSEMKDGDVVLLENTRYRKEETKNEDNFSQELASLAEVYVNDAFGSSHRAHCSTVGVTKYVKEAAVGYLMEKEINFLGNAVNNPERPFVAILGGSKVSDKINVINNLLEKVDTLIIGGGMAYTFIVAKGGKVGNSLLEADKVEYAKEMMKKAEEKGVKFLLPIDTVITKEFKNDTEFKTVPTMEIPDGWEGLDIGEESQKVFADALKDAKTVVWNGPMGVFEFENFAKGTNAVAKALSEIKATTIIGGGDSAAAVNQLGYGDKMTHISTGGGASLEFLEGKELPGVVAVDDK